MDTIVVVLRNRNSYGKSNLIIPGEPSETNNYYGPWIYFDYENSLLVLFFFFKLYPDYNTRL